MSSRRITLGLVLLLAAMTRADEPNWPQFRGPGSRGVFESASLPVTWSNKENVAWAVDVPGLGWSSPVIAGNRIFLTSAIKEGGDEKAQMGLYIGKTRGGGIHHWVVYCFDLSTGKRLWDREVHNGQPTNIHLKNSYATQTPVTDGQRVYAYLGEAGKFVSFDMDGKPLWSIPLGPFKMRYDWGSAASPILYKDRLYLVSDNEEQSFLLCLDAATGKELWRKPREKESNWSTPYIWESGQRTELIVPASKRVISYDLAGNELWSLSGMSSITIATPYSANGLLYISSGYVGDRLRPIYAIRPGASGDISLKETEDHNEFIAWCNRTAAPYNASTLVYDKRLYILHDRGFFGCLDAMTGKEVYPKQRIEVGGTGGFTASPWAANGKIYCLSEAGLTTVIQAGDTFKILATNPLDEICMATPAITPDSFIIRTAGKLYRIRNAAGGK
jgi:outer membrane protein assembly factor BamB